MLFWISKLWHQLCHSSDFPSSPVCVWTPPTPAASRYRPDGQRAASVRSAGNGCPWNTIFKLRDQTHKRRNRGGKRNSGFQSTVLGDTEYFMSDLVAYVFSPHSLIFLLVMKTIWADCPREELTFVHMASKDNSRIQEFWTQTVNTLEIIHQFIFDVFTRMENKVWNQLTEDLISLSLRNFIGYLSQIVQ